MKRVALASLLLIVAACAGANEPSDAAVIEVFGPYVGDEAEAFTDYLASAERPGLDILYVGSLDFKEDLAKRVESGEPPDLAVTSDLRNIEELAAAGNLVELPSVVAERATSPLLESADFDFGAVALPYRLRLNSLVWYRSDIFARNGWQPPTSLDELLTLTRNIAATGRHAPWCAGFNDLSEPGWPASNWIEDLLLRRGGTEVYDAWLDNELPYTDPIMFEVFDEFKQLLLEPSHNDGALIADLTRANHREATESLLENNPDCVMVKASSAAAAWLGNPIKNNRRQRVFALPGASVDDPPPLTVSVESIVSLVRSPEAEEVLTVLSSQPAGSGWERIGGFVSTDAFSNPAGDFAEFIGPVHRVDVSESMTSEDRQSFYATLQEGVRVGFDDLDFELELLENVRIFHEEESE